MEELISGYNSLKYSSEALQFPDGDLLSDTFYQNYAAAVLIVNPDYDFYDETYYNTLRFQSAYLSGETLALNYTDTHENRILPYAEFVRLNRADILDAAIIR